MYCLDGGIGGNDEFSCMRKIHVIQKKVRKPFTSKGSEGDLGLVLRVCMFYKVATVSARSWW